MKRLAAVSVDLDPLHHYAHIHGLKAQGVEAPARSLVHEVALPRFLSLFEELGLPATFFVIGADLSHPRSAERVREAHQAGMELGSHSHHHDYGLSRWDFPRLLTELREAQDCIEEVSGTRPEGFRAPGYALSPALYQAAAACGLRYGSSVFPSVPYYLAKGLVMGALRVLGRPSGAHLDSPQVLAAPLFPYWPDPEAPYRKGKGRVLELPLTVAPLSRLPFLGTLALGMPLSWTRALYRSCRQRFFFNFELHGLDLLDAHDGVPKDLVRRQRELSLPWQTKRARLKEILGWLQSDFTPGTLGQVASQLSQPLSGSRLV